ncbi:hypothetical protein BDV93DRAFT_552565 [Ceratobasidium sp. AG-I]|nr:hypothetical protein BDV93DRAFT_552565 [Ceratobasidium sp. AG-I]
MAHDEMERNEGGIRMYATPTTPNVDPTSLDDLTIDLDTLNASKTPNSVHTGPDDGPDHSDMFHASPSHRAAHLHDQEPTTLENAGQVTLASVDCDHCRFSTSRDTDFDEGGTAREGIENECSQKPTDRRVVSMDQNGGKATKSDRRKAPRCPPEALEAPNAFERPTDGPGLPIRPPEAPKSSQVPRTTPNPLNRPPLTGHAPERGDDLSGGVYDAHNVSTPFPATHEGQHTQRDAPERIHATPSMRTRTPTVFDDGVNTAQNDGEDKRTNVPSRPTSPTHPLEAPQPPQPFKTHSASSDLMEDTAEHTGCVGHANDAPAETAETHEAKQADRDEGHADRRIRAHTAPTPNPTYTGSSYMSGDRITRSKHLEHATTPTLNEPATCERATPKGLGGAKLLAPFDSSLDSWR